MFNPALEIKSALKDADTSEDALIVEIVLRSGARSTLVVTDVKFPFTEDGSADVHGWLLERNISEVMSLRDVTFRSGIALKQTIDADEISSYTIWKDHATELHVDVENAVRDRKGAK